jgi:hypothetical protein
VLEEPEHAGETVAIRTPVAHRTVDLTLDEWRDAVLARLALLEAREMELRLILREVMLG